MGSSIHRPSGRQWHSGSQMDRPRSTSRRSDTPTTSDHLEGDTAVPHRSVDRTSRDHLVEQSAFEIEVGLVLEYGRGLAPRVAEPPPNTAADQVDRKSTRLN